jgi:hypothetical protein
MEAFCISNTSITLLGPSGFESETNIDLMIAEPEDLTLAALKIIDGHNHEPVPPTSFLSIKFNLILITPCVFLKIDVH